MGHANIETTMDIYAEKSQIYEKNRGNRKTITSLMYLGKFFRNFFMYNKRSVVYNKTTINPDF